MSPETKGAGRDLGLECETVLLGLELELLRHVLDQLGQREGFEVKLPALALQHRQLEQLGDQLVQALAVFGGEVQVVAPFGLAEFAPLIIRVSK